MSTNITEGVFRNKSQDPFVKTPSHGTPAWRPSGDQLEAVTLWDKGGECKWMTVAEYQSRISSIKARNIAFYEANREALFRKIRVKQGRVNMLGRNLMSGMYNMP